MEKSIPAPEKIPGLQSRHLMALGSLAAGAALLDQFAGTRKKNQLSPEPDFIASKDEESEQTLVIFPGCQADGRAIAETLTPHLNTGSNLLFAEYPEDGFDIDEIYGKLIDTLRENELKNLSFLGASMGGMAVAECLKRYQEDGLAEEFGEIDTVVMDSSPSEYSDIGRDSRSYLWLARHTGNSFVLNAWKSHLMRNYHPLSAPDVANSVAREQSQFMRNFHMEEGELEGIAKKVVYIDGPHDPVVNTNTALEGWKKIYRQDLAHLRDYSRPHGNHVGSIRGYPEETIKQFEKPIDTAVDFQENF